MAKSADVVVLFVGTDDRTANEEADRLTLVLPGNQYELIDAVAAVNPNTVVVMQTLGMVEVDRFKDNPNIAGIIWTGFNGQAQGTAIARILFGDVFDTFFDAFISFLDGLCDFLAGVFAKQGLAV